MDNIIERKEKVIAYIDGFNLYFGIVDAGFEYCKWLNLKLLVQNLLKPNQELIEVKYFTSRVSNNPDKQKRQSLYIEALESIGIKIIYGNYQDGNVKCLRCGHIWKSAKEKMTDVNIATAIIIDAYKNIYDVAMLISGDTDLIPPIREIHSIFKDKRVLIAFPPKRHNKVLAIAAKGSFVIGRKKLVESQLNKEMISLTGYKIIIPRSWKKNED
jgi:uncharacterized LabA/DUF88 family protein